MLAIFPIQDWLAIDAGLRREDFMSERVNYPADPQNKWKFRLHLNLEDLVSQQQFNNRISSLIIESNR